MFENQTEEEEEEEEEVIFQRVLMCTKETKALVIDQFQLQ